MNRLFPILFISLSFSLHAQAQLSPMQAFRNLAGSTWVSEGIQLGGKEGRTEKKIAFGLDGNIVKVQTYIQNSETKQMEIRNDGIRAWNAQDSTIQIFECDIFGGVTQGKVLTTETDIHYEYHYHGVDLRDSWIYKDKDTYQYIVGVWKDGEWEKIYHQGVYKRLK